MPLLFSLDWCTPFTLFPFSSTCTCCDWTLIQSEEAGCAEFMVFTCRGRELDLFPCLASCCKTQASQFLPLFYHPAKTLLLPAWTELLAFLYGADVPQKFQEDCWKPFANLCTLPICHLWQLLRPMWAEVCLEQQPLGGWIPVWVPNIFLFLINVLLSFWAGGNLVCEALLCYWYSCGQPLCLGPASQTQQCSAFVLL